MFQDIVAATWPPISLQSSQRFYNSTIYNVILLPFLQCWCRLLRIGKWRRHFQRMSPKMSPHRVSPPTFVKSKKNERSFSKTMSVKINQGLKVIRENFKRYCESIRKNTGCSYFWSVASTQDILNNISNVNVHSMGLFVNAILPA